MTIPSVTGGMRFTPQMYMDYHVRRLGIQIEDIGVAPTVIVTWFTRVRESLTRAVNGDVLANAPFRHAYTGYRGSVSAARAVLSALAQRAVCNPSTQLGACWFLTSVFEMKEHPGIM